MSAVDHRQRMAAGYARQLGMLESSARILLQHLDSGAHRDGDCLLARDDDGEPYADATGALACHEVEWLRRALQDQVCDHCWGERGCMSPTHRGREDTNACCICGTARTPKGSRPPSPASDGNVGT